MPQLTFLLPSSVIFTILKHRYSILSVEVIKNSRKMQVRHYNFGCFRKLLQYKSTTFLFFKNEAKNLDKNSVTFTKIAFILQQNVKFRNYNVLKISYRRKQKLQSKVIWHGLLRTLVTQKKSHSLTYRVEISCCSRDILTCQT